MFCASGWKFERSVWMSVLVRFGNCEQPRVFPDLYSLEILICIIK